MARTKASVGAKVAAGKSSKARCSAAPPSTSSASGSGERSSRSGHSGGNTVCPRETPKWQRPITNFFMGKEVQSSDEGESSGTSKPSKRNIIESDDEEENQTENLEPSTTPEDLNEKPKNQELDETLELEPLTGDDSHKIEEYYPKNGIKGKGKGKKTKNKENIDSNVEKRKSVKRDLDNSVDEANTTKKVKVN